MITQRALIADRDPHMQAFVRRALAKFRVRLPELGDVVRFTTHAVSTDDGAIQELTVDPPDILVMEDWAPRLSSIKILEAMQSLHPTTVAIVAATRPTIPAAVAATKQGAFEYLAKPLTRLRFLEVVVEATAAQMGCVSEPDCSSENGIQNTARNLSTIPATLANFAATAASLYW